MGRADVRRQQRLKLLGRQAPPVGLSDAVAPAASAPDQFTAVVAERHQVPRLFQANATVNLVTSIVLDPDERWLMAGHQVGRQIPLQNSAARDSARFVIDVLSFSGSSVATTSGGRPEAV